MRGPEDLTPILNPPPHPPAAATATTGESALAAAGYIPTVAAVAGARGGRQPAAVTGHFAPQPRPPAQQADPFAGMSEEDRLAVQAAMAEMDHEERAVRESG